MESKAGKLVVVSGPSGVGKSTILAQALPLTGAEFSVSATTREPRCGEVDGEAYHFVSRERFKEMIAGDELLEWAEVFGHFYGTPVAPIREAMAAGRTVVLDIDVQGGLQVRRLMPDATFVLIVPPCDEELRRRLEGRGSESPQNLSRRLAKAHAEIDMARQSGAYDFEVVNQDLDSAIQEIAGIIKRETK